MVLPAANAASSALVTEIRSGCDDYAQHHSAAGKRGTTVRRRAKPPKHADNKGFCENNPDSCGTKPNAAKPDVVKPDADEPNTGEGGKSGGR